LNLVARLYTRGALGARAHPQGGEKIWHNLQGKVVTAPREREQEVKFLRTFLLDAEIWRLPMVNLAVLACVCRQVFRERKVNPSEKILATPIYSVSQKNIPDIFSCNSRKHCRIFIIFGTRVTEKVSNRQLL